MSDSTPRAHIQFLMGFTQQGLYGEGGGGGTLNGGGGTYMGGGLTWGGDLYGGGAYIWTAFCVNH